MAIILRTCVQGYAARWVVYTLFASGVMWIAAFAGLLGVAKQAHVDVPYALALKLPLLQSRPDLVFAGESRTEYQVDAELAARITGRPIGGAVNIAYEAGEPLAVLGAIRQQPDLFGGTHVVISVAPFLFNEGVRSAAVYPQDVAARLGVFDQMVSFLPLRIGTLIRFVREAFNARLAFEQNIAGRGARPSASGLSTIDRAQREDNWPRDLGTHPHYGRWNLSGPKARYETLALCDMAGMVRKLTVVVPPWAPRYDRGNDPLWQEKDDQYVALLSSTGRRCGFEVLNVQAVPGLDQSKYADEMHLIASGIPIYTRYLVAKLGL
ncbi:MAG: hypothetical protein KIT82_10210 [Bradyrhizobium sp.]|nr:hypothetical protein [Bradyrhizobium sp.]